MSEEISLREEISRSYKQIRKFQIPIKLAALMNDILPHPKF